MTQYIQSQDMQIYVHVNKHQHTHHVISFCDSQSVPEFYGVPEETSLGECREGKL